MCAIYKDGQRTVLIVQQCYDGNSHTMIDTIDVRDTSRERLWRDYICKRQPVS